MERNLMFAGNMSRISSAILSSIVLLVNASCGERLVELIYTRCNTSADCGGETCVKIRGPVADGGSASVGICTRGCTVSTLADSVYIGAKAFGDVCVGVDAVGNVDTSVLGGSGWYLRACGGDHWRVGVQSMYSLCTGFDYGGYPIDLWIPLP